MQHQPEASRSDILRSSALKPCTFIFKKNKKTNHLTVSVCRARCYLSTGTGVELKHSTIKINQTSRHFRIILRKCLCFFFFVIINGRRFVDVLTLKPPIRWSFLNSLPFFSHLSVGVGLPMDGQRNLTVLLAGTAWSFFSILSG